VRRIDQEVAVLGDGPEPTIPTGALVIGRVAAVMDGVVMVTVGAEPMRLYRVVHAAVAPSSDDIGCEVVLQAARDVREPDGRIWFLVGKVFGGARPPEETGPAAPLRVELGRDLVVTSGKATITLTTSGEIRLEGEYVVSDAAGANRIRGATVELN
jgi:hypothetical protein